MSFTITKATFTEEVEPWDDGPHTIYEVCYNGTDHTYYFLKTRSGKWTPLFSAGANMLAAIHYTNEEVNGEEASEVMDKYHNLGVPVAEPPVGLSAVSPASAPEDATSIPHAERIPVLKLYELPVGYKQKVYLNAVTAEYGSATIKVIAIENDRYNLIFELPEERPGVAPFVHLVEDGIGILSVGLSANAMKAIHHLTQLLSEHSIEAISKP